MNLLKNMGLLMMIITFILRPTIYGTTSDIPGPPEVNHQSKDINFARKTVGIVDVLYKTSST